MNHDLLDKFMPACDFTERQECLVSSTVDAAAAALRTHDIGAHSIGLRHFLAGARRFMAPPTAKATRLAQLGELRAAALEQTDRALILGFLGPVWQPGAPFAMPPASDFFTQADASPQMARIVWCLQAGPHGNQARLSLDLRLRYPESGNERRAFLRYWRLAHLPSKGVRAYLLRCIAARAQ